MLPFNKISVCIILVMLNTELAMKLKNIDKSIKKSEDLQIYFHETSKTGYLNPRQACAVESAARVHPNTQINLMFSDLTEQGILKYTHSKPLQTLRQFENVKIATINLLEYCKGTPLASLVNSGKLEESSYVASHTSDVLRFVSLYKYGGIYLDLDVIVAKSLEPLGANWVGKENDNLLNSACMRFSMDGIGRKVASKAVQDLTMNFDGSIFNNNGPGVVTRVMKKICNTTDISSMTLSACGGFAVYDRKWFYPISDLESRKYFKPGDIDNSSFVYHFWNRLTQYIDVLENSPYDKLAKKFCKTFYL